MKRKSIYLVNLLVAFFIVNLLIMISCEPSPKITFVNQRNQDVTIFATRVRSDGTTSNFVKQGVIFAHSTNKVSITFIGDDWVNRIEARDSSGNIVFSGDYTMKKLKEINWIIVILNN
jgi:hypothetical protein